MKKTIHKVLIIGSGPIVIGQAAEFDYSGTQACLAAKEEGVQTILVNSNPATIQTDPEIADLVYIEPLTVGSLEKIIAKEKPDGLIATVGGQTALNLAVKLDQKGILKKYQVKVLGTDITSIQLGEDRGKFKNCMEKINLPVPPSAVVKNVEDAQVFASQSGFPLVIRSAFNLGGTGSSIVKNLHELKKMVKNGLQTSIANEVLVEKSLIGWAELEYEIVRDNLGNIIMVCHMENIDPMGVHTGESIVVSPSQTLSDDDHQKLRAAAFSIVSALNIQGGCNIQFALNQKTGKYFVIEVNPRLSRSSALASKATGYPIARVATKIALGKSLPEITNDITGKTAFFEPALDYVVIKIPKWPDDKFTDMDTSIGITMKSTGEVMAIGRSFEEALLKAIDSFGIKEDFYTKYSLLPLSKIQKMLAFPNTQRLSAIFSAFSSGLSVSMIASLTKINPWFIHKMKNLYHNRENIKSDITVYKMVDTCAGEFKAITPYFYSTHGIENEATPLSGPKVIILGSGPIKIGQGIEFDYLTVHAIKALKEKGIKSIIINNNPETVSTDYAMSDRLYFEPLTKDFVLKVIDNEKDGLLGVLTQFGGQTAINLAEPLEEARVKILGTNSKSIELAEDREKTAKVINQLGYLMPEWTIARNKEELLEGAKKLGYSVLIRPSFVLAGEGMIIAKNIKEVTSYLSKLKASIFDNPVLIDTFLKNAKEIDLDFVSDGTHTASFILEQFEEAGIHSGDSSCVYPPQTLTVDEKGKIIEMAEKVSKAFGIVGIGNIQCALKGDKMYILEINPRASRTVPFLSKCIRFSLAKLATKIALGDSLPQSLPVKNGIVAIKRPVFSFDKLSGVSPILGPLMKSTGEVMFSAHSFQEVLEKSAIY